MIKIKNFIRKLYQKYKGVMIRSAVRAALTSAAVWVGNAVLDFILYFVFNNVFSVPAIFSQIISYTLATVNRFYMYKIIKYDSRGHHKYVKVQLVQFLTVSFWALSSSSLIMTFLNGFGVGVFQSKILVTGYTTLMNILGQRYIVFKDEQNSKKED